MRRREDEITIGRQQSQPVTNAELRENGVDRADLHAGSTTPISEFRSLNVIPAVRLKERKCLEPLDDDTARPRTGEPLQQFLQDHAGRQDRMASFERNAQRLYLRHRRVPIAPKGQRPDARIDEQTHRRERSAL